MTGDQPMAFTLDATLERDTATLGRLALCRVLLMNDRRFDWLILVPERDGAREIHDLPASDRALLMQEAASVSKALQAHSGADKMNVAALGNQVAQLHVHVIARFRDDAAWPGPVWCTGKPEPFEPAALAERAATLAGALGLPPSWGPDTHA